MCRSLAGIFLALAGSIGFVCAETPEEFEAKLGYQTGTVHLGDGMATVRLPESFRFLGPEGSRRLLVDAWGNPPEAATGVLGMLVPTAVSPLSDAVSYTHLTLPTN